MQSPLKFDCHSTECLSLVGVWLGLFLFGWIYQNQNRRLYEPSTPSSSQRPPPQPQPQPHLLLSVTTQTQVSGYTHCKGWNFLTPTRSVACVVRCVALRCVALRCVASVKIRS